MLADPEVSPDQCLRRGCSQANNYFRLHGNDLCLDPRPASLDLGNVRFLVNAAFATRLPFEVLDDVGYVYLRPIYARLLKRLIQHPPGRTNKRLACEIFIVARLFTDQHHASSGTSLAEDCLCSALPEIARLAILRSLSQSRNRRLLGYQVVCGTL